ncbi:MAG: haloacid dehalogenase-like hydrolase, partial [Planctomycetota bacterium]|nr:haloacid dehalogenase-like hydrolase [Planctomycetota bacterium]
GVASFRAGKAERLEAWLARRGASLEGLEDSMYFGDSRSDLPLLERVARPVAVGPDEVLRARAEERGWEIVEAGTRG